jgi:hypothetical protein
MITTSVLFLHVNGSVSAKLVRARTAVCSSMFVSWFAQLQDL